MAFIKAISYYLPEYNLSNEIINKNFPEWSVDKISSKTGIYERRIAAPDEFSSDMAVTAANKLFQEHSIDKSTIDFILLCTQSPDYFLPTTACILQDRIGLSTSAGALDYNLGCSGFVYGLAMAKGLIAGGMANNVLLLTSETYSKYIHDKDKSNLTIFGDAAAATLVSKDTGFCAVNDFVFGTDGKGAANLIVKQGGMRYPLTQAGAQEITDDYNNVHSDRNLYMDGSEIFNFTLTEIPKLVRNVLDKNKLIADDINLYIFHQANKFVLNLKRKLKINDSNFFTWMESCGNTVSSTIPIALYHAQKQNAIPLNGKILLAGFGVGYSWAGCVLSV